MSDIATSKPSDMDDDKRDTTEEPRDDASSREHSASSHSHHKHHRCRHTRDHDQDDEDSGCECSLDELEGMDAWTKTLVAIKVLTAFKKRRKKKMEQEKAKKERRKTLWKRLGFKLRVFNIFANKISSDDPNVERLVKLKRKLGRKYIVLILFLSFLKSTWIRWKMISNKNKKFYFSFTRQSLKCCKDLYFHIRYKALKSLTSNGSN